MGTEGIRNKSLVRQLWAIQISARHTCAADVHFSRHADWQGLPLLIENANAPKVGAYVAIHALNALDALGGKAAPWKQEIVALPAVDPKSPARVNTEYTGNLLREAYQALDSGRSAGTNRTTVGVYKR